jgi:methionyl-tRNA formyltransferase
LVPSPVKTRALAAGLTVLQPQRPSGDVLHQTLRNLSPDLGIVVAYGHLLRPEVLGIPPLGMVNVHASLLPRWRGAAPIQWALLSGDIETGVSIMRVEQGLDTGAVWFMQRVPITQHDTTASLTERLAYAGAEGLLETLPRIASGIAPEPQAELGITLAPKIDRTSARIQWADTAEEVSARIRAMDPAPGAWASIGGMEVKLFSPDVLVASGTSAEPGTVVGKSTELVIATGRGCIEVAEVQPAGRRRMPAADWLRGGATREAARFT